MLSNFTQNPEGINQRSAPAPPCPASSGRKGRSGGWFDVSGFLDTAYGFVPLVVPITEPAVGYSAAGAGMARGNPDSRAAPRRNP